MNEEQQEEFNRKLIDTILDRNSTLASVRELVAAGAQLETRLRISEGKDASYWTPHLSQVNKGSVVGDGDCLPHKPAASTRYEVLECTREVEAP